MSTIPRRKSDSCAEMVLAVAAASPDTMSEGTYNMLKPPVTASSRYSNPAVRAVVLAGFICPPSEASRRSAAVTDPC